MRACVQRVSRARVLIDDEIVGEIGAGLVVLLGVEQSDTLQHAEYLSKKICGLRIFDDDLGKMNLSLIDCGGQMLVISQFTLYGDCRKGRRPNFAQAAAPEIGSQLYEHFVQCVRAAGIPTSTGQFRASMQVELVNEGPVTMLLDSNKIF